MAAPPSAGIAPGLTPPATPTLPKEVLDAHAAIQSGAPADAVAKRFQAQFGYPLPAPPAAQ